MNAILRCFSVWLTLSSLVGCGGPRHDIAWMPDSSGFLFRKSDSETSDIIHFDLERNAMRPLILGDRFYAGLPGISPDGKQMALAKVNRSPSGSTVQICIYDISGDPRNTSEEFPAGSYEWWSIGIQRSSVHWSVDGVHLVITANDDEIVGSFNIRTNTFRRSSRIETLVASQFVVTPDGKGFIARHPAKDSSHRRFDRVVFVDWEGWEHPFTLEPTDLMPQKDQARSFSWFRNGNKVIVEEGRLRATVDVSTRSVSYSETPGSNLRRSADELEIRAFFSSGKACVALWNSGKQNGEEYHDVLSVRPTDQSKSSELLSDIAVQWFKVAPNDQMVAVMYVKNISGGKERHITVVKNSGEVIADILRDHVPSPAAK